MRLRQPIADVLRLATGLHAVFAGLFALYSHAGKENDRDILILRGVAETLSIKLESLQEGRTEYLHTCARLLRHTLSRTECPPIESVSAKLEKARHAFLKDHLLYETATFEDIVRHSVPHLPEALGIPAHSALSQLEDMLAAHGICRINPAPRTPFSAREHTILLAENHDGFAKGEVVECLNSGYILEEMVLLRANIIAAK